MPPPPPSRRLCPTSRHPAETGGASTGACSVHWRRRGWRRWGVCLSDAPGAVLLCAQRQGVAPAVNSDQQRAISCAPVAVLARVCPQSAPAARSQQVVVGGEWMRAGRQEEQPCDGRVHWGVCGRAMAAGRAPGGALPSNNSNSVLRGGYPGAVVPRWWGGSGAPGNVRRAPSARGAR
jgi:hypothetical protein